MGLFSRKKKPDRFLELLIKQAEYAVEGMDALRSYVNEPDRELARQVSHAEKEADEVRRILIDELHRHFVRCRSISTISSITPTPPWMNLSCLRSSPTPTSSGLCRC